MKFDRPMIEEELGRLREAVKRRAAGEPWQYIAGEVEFLGCGIRVNRAVLIPRQETEILVDQILKELPDRPLEIWDICTGSGCIGIALKKKRPDCKVVLSDLSEEALQMAQENVALNRVEVELLKGDLLAPFQGRKADVVVCNPPYVTEGEYLQLDREVREWEPRMALVGGYTFYERMSRELPQYLNRGAKIYFEIGAKMGEEMKNIFSGWGRQELLKDWSSHDRYYKLEIE